MYRSIKKYDIGGEIPDINSLIPTTFQQKQPTTNNSYYRPYIFKPQASTLQLKDNRKINATSGKQINKDKDLSTGNYSTDRINNIVHYAKQYGIDPYNLLAMDLQETSLGKTNKDRHKGYVTPPGHVLMKEEDLAPSKNNFVKDLQDNKIDFDTYNLDNGYDVFARAYKAKALDAKNQGLTKDVDVLQNYNGRGKIVPSTEQSYNGFKMKSIYGVDVPSTGIDMKTNPLYGKRIEDLRDNVIKQSPQFRDAVENTYAKGGSINSMYKNIKKYADGVDFYTKNQNAIVAGGNFLGSAVDSFNNQQNPDTAMSGFSGALKGAAAGTAVLPGVGTAIGAGIGLISGIVGGSAKHNAYIKAQQDRWTQVANNAKSYSDNTLRQYDTSGIPEERLYDEGGPIMGRDTSGVNKIKYDPTKQPTYNPSLLTNGKFMVEKADGSLGQWGNPLNTPQPNLLPFNKLLIPISDKARGLSNVYYPGNQQQQGKSVPTQYPTRFEQGGRVKRKIDPNVEIPNFALYNDGGQLGQPYEVEKNEVVQGNPNLEESTELASDLHKVGGDTHENGGTMGSGGERVFSDRLKVSDNLLNILKTSGISVAKGSTYAEASDKLGKLKGKLEDKKDGTGKNTAQLMIPRIDQALDDTFNDQEMGKGYNKSRKYASGGRLGQIDTGNYAGLLDGGIDTGLPQESIDPNMTLQHNYIPDENPSVLNKVGNFLNKNTGQVANAANYLSNMSSINGLDTKVTRNYMPLPQYNYVDRSGYAYNKNNSALNTGIKSLSNTGRSVNAANIAGLYSKTLDSNSNIALNEAARKDAYTENYNQRLDRVNSINTQMQNEASDQQRAINNEKVGLKLGAKNALLTGIQGNIASKKAEDFQNKQLLAILAGNDQNGVMTRFLKNYPTYKNLLKTYNSTTD